MNHSHINTLISKFFAKNISSKEQEQLNCFLEKNPEQRNIFRTLRNYWIHPQCNTTSDQKEKAFDQLMQNIKIKEMKHRFRKWYIAASILLLISLSTNIAILYQNQTKNQDTIVQNTHIQTHNRQSSEVTLGDGSHAWLNSDSKLTLLGKRVVKLHGEAYFEINKSENQPFNVKTDLGNILVKGTKFNIRVYKNENKIEASLLEGKISYHFKDQQINLKPGEILTKEKDQPIKVQTIDPNNISNWRKGIVQIRNLRFDMLMKELERHYNIYIHFDKSKFKEISYTGTLDNLSIYKIMEYLSYSMPIEYKYINKDLYITMKQ